MGICWPVGSRARCRWGAKAEGIREIALNLLNKIIVAYSCRIIYECTCRKKHISLQKDVLNAGKGTKCWGLPQTAWRSENGYKLSGKQLGKSIINSLSDICKFGLSLPLQRIYFEERARVAANPSMGKLQSIIYTREKVGIN